MRNLRNLLNEVDSLLNNDITLDSDADITQPEVENDELLNELEKYFQYNEFREGQRKIIETILNGEDVFAVYPTGHGKSLCYQLPALMLPGITVVVSPLISLMKDQVDTLRQQGIKQVSLINSMQSWEENRKEMNRIQNGDVKIIYVSPERLHSRRFLDLLNTSLISLFVIDEAHCISQWGHDFRPAYLSICNAIDTLFPKSIALFTATATPDIRDDVVRVLKITKPKVLVGGIERPNLRLKVYAIEGKDKEEQKYEFLKQYISSFVGKGIIYAGRRRETEDIADFLQKQGCSADYYHAGRDGAERKHIQEAFFDDSTNGLDIVAATNAFGMGIDKADIRHIIHWTMTGTLEEYCQEIGRAGRDGKPSECILFYMHKDTELHEWFIKESAPDKSSLLRLLQGLENMNGTGEYRLIAMEELAWRLGFKDTKLQVGLSYLEKLGFIKRWNNLPSRVSVAFRSQPKDTNLEQSKLYSQLRQQRVTDILRFCQTLELSPKSVMEQLSELQNEGHLQYWGKDELMLIEIQQDSEFFASISDAQMGLGDYVKHRKNRIDKMVYYATSDGCRMKTIREYFGEEVSKDYKCNNCDRC